MIAGGSQNQNHPQIPCLTLDRTRQVWSNQKQIDEAKGQNKTNELLWNAARIGDMTQAELLVKKAGAELAAIDRSSGMTALHHAVNQAQGRMASHLISLGSAVNQRDADSMTPLHIAAAQANTSMAALLLGHGAEVNPADSMGWTPMHHVAASNPLTDQGNITRLLVASGADLGARDALNRTPAELADALGEVDLAEFLSAMERGDGSVEETAMGMTLPVPQPSWDDAARRSTRGGEECSLEELLRIYRLGKGTAAAGTEGAQTATATATTTPTARMEGGDGGDNDGNCDGRDRMFEPFRRYDGKDWADGKEPEKIKELVGLMETFPAAFFNEEQFKRLESAGLIERRLDWVEAGARAEEERKRRAAATMKEYAQLW